MRTAQRSAKPKQAKVSRDVIATRKSCQAQGTGLSHYILMDRKNK